MVFEGAPESVGPAELFGTAPIQQGGHGAVEPGVLGEAMGFFMVGGAVVGMPGAAWAVGDGVCKLLHGSMWCCLRLGLPAACTGAHSDAHHVRLQRTVVCFHAPFG